MRISLIGRNRHITFLFRAFVCHRFLFLNLFFFFHFGFFLNSINSFATSAKAMYRPQLARYGCLEEITQHTHIHHGKIRSYFFYFVGHLPFAVFWLNSWMCSHLCRAHGYRSPVVDRKKKQRLQHEPLPGCAVRFARPGTQNKWKSM